MSKEPPSKLKKFFATLIAYIIFIIVCSVPPAIFTICTYVFIAPITLWERFAWLVFITITDALIVFYEQKIRT